MESNCFTDNPNRYAVALFGPRGKHFENKPACYILENRINQNMYVGSTKNISARINSHKQMLKNNIHSNGNLQEDFNNNAGMESYIVHVCPTETVDEARDREQLILDEGWGAEFLLNRSDNARNPFPKDVIESNIEKLNAWNRMPENRDKVAEESKTRWEDPELRQKMISGMGENVTVNGVLYGSVRQASREVGVSIATIRRRLIDGVATIPEIKTCKKVSVDGVVFESVSDAAKSLGIANNTMTWRLQQTTPRWKDYIYL